MLDIPESVKALFDRDGIRKNFRAVFDSGRPDITNANIVAESLSFSESISSSDSLAFGSAEASVLQFETVGLSNMMGLWFSAYIEIDATTLPADLQTVRPDLSFPVYPLPLGRFVVTECPRNHDRMVHRRVVAMSEQQSADGYTTDSLRNICRWECISNRPTTLYMPLRGDTALLVAGFDAEKDPAYYTTVLAETVDISDIERPDAFAYGLNLGMYASAEATTSLTLGTLNLTGYYPFPADKEEAIGAYYSFADWDPDQKIGYDELITWLKDLIIDTGGAYKFRELPPGTSGLPGVLMTAEEIEAKLRETVPRSIVTNAGTLVNSGMSSSPFVSWMATTPLGRSSVFAPIIGKAGTASMGLSYTYGVFLSGRNILRDQPIQWARSIVSDPEAIRRGSISIEIKRYAKPAAARNATDNILINLETVTTFLGENQYSLDFDLSGLSKLVQSFLELSGQFTKYGRDGVKRPAKLEKVNPVIINRRQYESCWWDEYDISPIGAIEYTLNGTTYTHTIGPGLSVYSLARPEALDKIEGLTEEKANEILDTMLAPSLQGITFTPYNLDAVALPYLEAGDYINIVAEDGTVVESFILERQITDAGRLTDSMKANGLTVEEAVDE